MVIVGFKTFKIKAFSCVVMIVLHYSQCDRFRFYGDVITGHGAGDGRTWCRERWWSRNTLCNTQGSETSRCIYMQVVLWLQTYQSLSDKVQNLPVFLLSPYYLFSAFVPVFPVHSEDTHWPTVMSHWLMSLCFIFSGEWKCETGRNAY